MKIKYEIVDLTNNPQDLQPGDMVKLRKGLKIYQRYDDMTLFPIMRFRYYKTIISTKNFFSGDVNVKLTVTSGETEFKLFYSSEMLDLTCVKRPIKVEELS